MNSTPYHICVFTIKKSELLDEFFENGNKGKILEKKRWVEASAQKAKADAVKQPFFVVFAAGEEVEELLYYAVLDDIRVHPTKRETVFEFSDMKYFEEPLPHKTDLVLVSTKQNIAEGHIRPYSICRTPPVLLGAILSTPKTQSILQPIIQTPELTLKNVRSETCDALFKATEKRMILGDDRIFILNSTADYDQKMQEKRRRRISQKLSEIFQQNYQLAITDGEIALCETVDNLVDLVRRKISKG